MRTERDNLGEMQMPADALYGLQSLRASYNFPASGEKVHPVLIKCFLLVKKACAKTNFVLGDLTAEKYSHIIYAIDILLDYAAQDPTTKGNLLFESIIVDPYQGGAGTSLNMNINEVTANLALQKAGLQAGEYNLIHPLDDINKNQSTNDTFPTAFKAAALYLLKDLQTAFSALQTELQKKETEFSAVLKLGRTQLQDAVPMTLGQEFGAWAQAISRDRWRFYNVEERLRSVNLGGTAIGNSVAASPRFVSQIYNELRAITGLPLAKSEDLIDGTQNLDTVVETHAILKTAAVSLQKMCNDLRWLSSGPYGGLCEIHLPEMQSGSTIMPGKVNPVILENAIQIAELVKGHDAMISNLVSMGNLELQQYMPMIAHLFLKSQSLLLAMVNNLTAKCITGIQADKKNCLEHLLRSTAISALLIPHFGYDKIAQLVKEFPGETSFLEFTSSRLSLSPEELLTIVKQEIGISLG